MPRRSPPRCPRSCPRLAGSMIVRWTLLALAFLPSHSAVGALAVPKKRSAVDVVSFGAHVGAAISAGAEILEDVENVGHGHGMLLLCGSKLCNEMNTVRGAVMGEAEDMEKSRRYEALRRPLDLLLRMLGSTGVVMGMALAALTAAALEVIKDVRPGGHHGAVFLAVNELLELLEASRIAKGRFLRLIENNVARLGLVGGAVIFASMETLRSCTKVGAHHGVLLLGVSKTLRCVGLLMEQRDTKEE